MRTALKQPLTEVPESVLKHMVNKDVTMALRKYKLGLGQKSTQRRAKSRDAPLEAASHQPRSHSQEKAGAQHNAIKRQIKELDSGVADRTSLLKMLVLRCDEANSHFDHLKSMLQKGNEKELSLE